MKNKLAKLTSNFCRDQSTESLELNGNNDYDIRWWIVFFAVVVFACLTRFHKVSEPDHVCWDETHFGKMASWYINRTFFFDVHPPLGKMLIAASGYLTGYNGEFSFSEPGAKFNGTSYLGMRMFCTALGSAIPPLSFITVWKMTESLHAAIFASSFILFDVGVITLTQYILLDPILLFFVMGAVVGIELVNSSKKEPFSVLWWFWLYFTGVMLGCAVSVKFVGLFVILYVGLKTVVQLWEVLGDTTRSLEYTLKHFFARFVTLILVPCVLYVGFFYIHLIVLNKSGNGDGFFSSAFQAQLKGNSLYEATVLKDVAHGSLVSIKSSSVSGGYLHSHAHLYPKGVGLRQQQVTTYMHMDGNNLWVLEKQGKLKEAAAGEMLIDYISDGDLVRIQHLSTGKYLRATEEAAPATSTHFQVTCFDIGIHFSEASENNGHIYLLGNPVIWAANIVLFVLFLIWLAWDCVKSQRGHLHATPTSAAHKRYLEGCLWLFTGWALHYVPFWTMQRILYFHHYFTALLFSSMLSGITLTYFLEILCDLLPPTHKLLVFNTLFSLCYCGIVYSFYLFAPLSYGIASNSDDPTSPMHNLRWMSSWEF